MMRIGRRRRPVKIRFRSIGPIKAGIRIAKRIKQEF